MKWLTHNYQGDSGAPRIMCIKARDYWVVEYGGESITITRQQIEDNYDPALIISDFIATTDRGEKFNGVSRQSHSSRSGNSAPAQSGAAIAYPCIICGLPGPTPSRACSSCLSRYLGADPGTVPPGQVNWPPSAIQQSIAGLTQQITADIRNAVMYGSSIPPSAYAQNLKLAPDDVNVARALALGASQAQQCLQQQRLRAMKSQQAWQQHTWSRAYAGLHDPAGTLDPPVPVSEFITGEIRAWRAWIIGENGYLRSISHSTVWPPGEVIEGKVTSAEHGGGVYAFKDRNKLFAFFMDGDGLNNLIWASNVVWGSVLLWGDVIEHELGYRAQFCQIDNLCGVYPATDIGCGPQIEDLRRVYGLTP